MMRQICIAIFLSMISSVCEAWVGQRPHKTKNILLSAKLISPTDSHCTLATDAKRRSLVHTIFSTALSPFLTLSTWNGMAESAFAVAPTDTAEITDRLFLDIKGLGGPSSTETKRIVIGLFGKDAPASVNKIKLMASSSGLQEPCRPRAERALQKDQLDANKVYNGCKENENEGVQLKYSTIWRVIKGERIDMGAVSGKFVSRENPNWEEAFDSGLRHDMPGIVSVRRGNDSGFGFTVYPGTGKDFVSALDQDHIVIGRVIDGMDVIRELDNVPVVSSAKVNYMALTGGPKNKAGPSRSCRYGGDMYCNEFKPLIKLTITDIGLL